MSSKTPEVVVIPGASAGVGRATAQAFAKHGAHIGLLARGIKALEGARQEMEELGGKALVPAYRCGPSRAGGGGRAEGRRDVRTD